ncbi:hypothetical protein MKW98_013331 [Papaver atlanticum]|uniref:RRM domain-containing protein n=1 Tax=Papaver atlanticum TaxID=357466 RepID=A0AAD4STS0_9MAGN|nr:hypothetical protein MKW98_013331 [Papaver atlanticum]
MLGVVSFTRCSSSSVANPIRFFNNNNKSHTTSITRLRAVSSISEFPLASKIVVTNLSHSTSDAVLKKKFSNFGQVVEVKLVTDESGKRSKGFAFIQYTCQDDAVLALESMDRKYIEGRLVYVDIAKPVTSTFGAYPRTSGPPKEQTS